MNPPTTLSTITGRSLRVYVGGWVLAALASLALTWRLGGPLAMDSWPRVVALWAAMVVAGLIHVRMRVRGTVEAADVVELAVVPLMVLLDPLPAVVIGGAAGLTFQAVVTRGQLHKLAFNMGWLVVAVAMGSWASTLVGGEFGPTPDVFDLAGAMTAGACYTLVNTLAFTGVVARQASRTWWSVLGEEVPGAALIGLWAVVLGILATVLAVTAPLALPLLALPLFLQRGQLLARSEGYHQLEAERERLRRTVADSSDGVVLLDASGRVEVWNPAMHGLTRVAEERAHGATLHELGLPALHVDGADTADERRVELGGRTVDVRRSRSAGAAGGTVLSVRDVTREAELAAIREDLVNRVSHELRTPLTTIGGFLELLQTRWDDLDEPGRRDLVSVAHRGADRLSTLVADLMTWARIEAREREPAAPGGAATCDVTEALGELATGEVPGGVRLEVDAGHRVAISPTELERVLGPLLANARVHGAPPVTVRAEPVDDRLRVVVCDEGPGLPVDRAEALFAPFTQGTVGLQRTETGLGLGLAIARGTAELAGGSLTYESSTHGHAFVVTLPSA